MPNLRVFELAQNEKPVIYEGQLRPICFEILTENKDFEKLKITFLKDKCAAEENKKQIKKEPISRKISILNNTCGRVFFYI